MTQGAGAWVISRAMPGGVIVDCALSRDGHRVGGRVSVEEAAAGCRAHRQFAWVGLADPTPEEVLETLRRFDLPAELAAQLAGHHERSQLRIADHTVRMIMRTARYLDDVEEVEFGQVAVVAADDVVVVVRLGEVNDLRPLRAALEDDPLRLAQGPSAVLAAIVAAVLDGYPRVLEGITDDIEEVEAVVFSESPAQPTKRIYDLNRELIELRRAIGPLLDAIAQLADETRAKLPPEQARWYRELTDTATRTMQSVESDNDLLANALSANLTQVSLRQNEDMRKISAWAAILALPTMIAGIYGMNFRHMPELRQVWGYPVVLVVMAVSCFVLYRRFKRIEWL
jgi:magnesium transporter